MNRTRIFCLLAAALLLCACTAAPSPAPEPTQTPTTAAQPTSAPAHTEASAAPTDVPEPGETATPEPIEQAPKTDILIVYFSRTGEQYNVGVIEKGNTAIVAEMIAELTGADLCELLPADDHYPLTYHALTDVAKQEQNENARPAYAALTVDLSQYSTVFIGAPVWWGDWPMILYTFFENNADALADKTLIPFSTHEGSGLSGFDRKLSAAVPNASVQKGLAVRGSDAQNKQDRVRSNVADWLRDLGF